MSTASASSPPPPTAEPFQATYRLLTVPFQVVTNSRDFYCTLDRLNAEFRSEPVLRPAGIYEALAYEDGSLWELTFQGEELKWFDRLIDAVSYIEWHMCDQAIERRHDLLHVHGAALATPHASLLLPGTSGIGKTTFALALALRGLRLLSDDVVFIHTDTWQVEPFPRSFHIHDDALPRLVPFGLRYSPEDHIGAYLCASVLGPWDRTPGPPLRYVLFPRLDPSGPLALEPISGAEAALELMKYSKNLRRLPRFGLDLVPRLLERTTCYVLRRNDDLGAAADLVLDLVQST
jgi:hypothetical protein